MHLGVDPTIALEQTNATAGSCRATLRPRPSGYSSTICLGGAPGTGCDWGQDADAGRRWQAALH